MNSKIQKQKVTTIQNHDRNSKTDEFSSGHENENSIELESRHVRARIFARWLIKTFLKGNNNADVTSGKTVIYDVAGGKGEIAFELCVRQRNLLNQTVSCVIVDPRKPNKFETGAVPRWQRKLIKVLTLLMT